jgi:hypothetical protein
LLTFICAGCDRDLGIGVDGLAEERRVCVRNSLLETRATLYVVSTLYSLRGATGMSHLGGGVLVAFDSVQRILCSIESELGRIITTARKD